MLKENTPGKIWLNIFLGLFYLFVFFILLKNSFGYLDPDFGWHLKVGEQIAQTVAVPDVDLYDYTLAGRSWVDFEWLMNLVAYLIYHNFGYIVLSIFFALLVLAALVVQLQFIRRNFLEADRGLIFVLALQFFGLYASLPHLGIRMQEITVLCLLLLSIIIFYYNKHKNFKILFWLLPLFFIWASTHAGFLAGLGLLIFFVFVKGIEAFCAKKFTGKFFNYKNVLTVRQLGVFSLFSFLALVITLATPYGLRLYEFLLGYQDSFYQNNISEWQGQWYYPFIYQQCVYLEIALLYLVLLFFAVFIFRGEHRRKLDLWSVCLVVLFSALAFKARRHFPLFFIVSLPIMAGFFLDFFRFMSWEKLKIHLWLKHALAFSSLAIILIAVVFAAVQINFTNYPETSFEKEFPRSAIVFLRAHPEWNDRRVFNEYGWGGYLIWQYPEKKLFIDGRLPQYPFNGTTMLQEYFTFFDKDKLAAKLKEHDIDLVLLKNKKQLPKISWWEKLFFSVKEDDLRKAEKDSLSLHDFLQSSGEWEAVYDDGLAKIFVKK